MPNSATVPEEKGTIEAFIDNGPLYSRWPAEAGGDFPFPKRPSKSCDNKNCLRETTWILVRSDQFYQGYSVWWAHYQCVLCQATNFVVLLTPVTWKKVQNVGPLRQESYLATAYEKIGHFPRMTIAISPVLARSLGDTADLYRKALICRNQGFGIAALAYMRRVVEDKTNELIEVIEDAAAGVGVDKGDIDKIRAAREEKLSFDQRIKLASEAMPSSLKPGGINSMEVLFGLISEGLHGHTEADCLLIADEIRDIFEYVFGQLRAQVEVEKNFVSKLQKWAGGQRPVRTK